MEDFFSVFSLFSLIACNSFASSMNLPAISAYVFYEACIFSLKVFLAMPRSIFSLVMRFSLTLVGQSFSKDPCTSLGGLQLTHFFLDLGTRFRYRGVFFHSFYRLGFLLFSVAILAAHHTP
jgi:hypothetical protein